MKIETNKIYLGNSYNLIKDVNDEKKYRIKYEICQIPSYEYDDEDEPAVHTATIKSESEEKAKEILERRFDTLYGGYIRILKINEVLQNG